MLFSTNWYNVTWIFQIHAIILYISNPTTSPSCLAWWGTNVESFNMGGSQFMALSMHPRPTHPLHFYHPLLSWAGGSSPPDRVSTQSPPSTRMCARTLQDWDSLNIHTYKQTHFQVFKSRFGLSLAPICYILSFSS